MESKPAAGSLQQQPNQQLLSNNPLQGNLQQPNISSSAQQPNLTNNLLQASLYQPNQLQASNPFQGSLYQPGLANNALAGSLQNPNLTSKLLSGPLQQASRLSPGSTQQLIKADRSTLTLSDDIAMVKQIQATHAPDGREIDVRPLLHLVEDILNRANLFCSRNSPLLSNSPIFTNSREASSPTSKKPHDQAVSLDIPPSTAQMKWIPFSTSSRVESACRKLYRH